MIPEIDRYHGVVLRQIISTIGTGVTLGVADQTGRLDSYHVGRGAIHIKYSSKRLSPWQFTYVPDNCTEIAELEKIYRPVWVALVCGLDGVVALSAAELFSILIPAQVSASSVRVRRSRNGMYRITGPAGELPGAKSRGVGRFIADLSSLSELR